MPDTLLFLGHGIELDKNKVVASILNNKRRLGLARVRMNNGWLVYLCNDELINAVCQPCYGWPESRPWRRGDEVL